MMGLPGSGKSYWVEKYTTSHPHTFVVSTDEIRERLYGDASIQGDVNEVFKIAFNSVKYSLTNNLADTVILDATNLSKKRRIHFLKNIKSIENVWRVCCCVISLYRRCVDSDMERERVVGEEVIKQMYTSFQPPHPHEGFDEVRFICDKQYNRFNNIESYDGFLERNRYVSQNNKHHTLSLTNHILKCVENIEEEGCTENERLAALFHDSGKPFCATNINKKGEVTEDTHYYNHQYVGAYIAIVEGLKRELRDEDICEISNLVYYHMHPLLVWNKSEKALERDRRIVGEGFIESVYKLHRADLKAH